MNKPYHTIDSGQSTQLRHWQRAGVRWMFLQIWQMSDTSNVHRRLTHARIVHRGPGEWCTPRPLPSRWARAHVICPNWHAQWLFAGMQFMGVAGNVQNL